MVLSLIYGIDWNDSKRKHLSAISNYFGYGILNPDTQNNSMDYLEIDRMIKELQLRPTSVDAIVSGIITFLIVFIYLVFGR